MRAGNDLLITGKKRKKNMIHNENCISYDQMSAWSIPKILQRSALDSLVYPINMTVPFVIWLPKMHYLNLEGV